MKAGRFLALLVALAVLASGLGLGGWWWVWRQGALRLAHRPLEVPRVARFVPRQAPLSLYLFSDGEQPVDYARAVAPPRLRREAAAAIERLRDGAFAAAGLDYGSELATWLAPEIGLALFDGVSDPGDPDAPAATGWLLALGSRDDEGARLFLQRFWQTRSLAGSGLQVSSYRGMGLISGRGSLLGRDPVPLATALVQDDLVLIASGRGVLEQALDVSQIDELNQRSLTALQSGPAAGERGAAVLLARPEAMVRWLGLPGEALEPAEGPSPSRLLAVLRPQGTSLRLHGSVEGADAPDGFTATPAGAADEAMRRRLVDALPGAPTSLALLQDPASLLSMPLLRPLVQRSALLAASAPAGAAAPGIDEGGPARALAGLVIAADRGALLAADGPEGWLLGTAADAPDPSSLEAALAARGLTPAPLERPDGPLLVWTRLSAGAGRSGTLQASLEGWRALRQGVAWWGGSLAALDARAGGATVDRRLRQLETLASPAAPLQWAMSGEPARRLLGGWTPWRLLAVLAGGDLDASVRGLALAVDPATPAAEPAGRPLTFRASLEFG